MQQAARIGALADELASKIDVLPKTLLTLCPVALILQARCRSHPPTSIGIPVGGDSGLWLLVSHEKIVWHGQSLPLRNDKLRDNLQRARAKEFDIDQVLPILLHLVFLLFPLF